MGKRTDFGLDVVELTREGLRKVRVLMSLSLSIDLNFYRSVLECDFLFCQYFKTSENTT